MPTQKVAFVTDDGETISQHFGRAQYYKVLTITDGEVVAEEMRDKMGHSHFVHVEQSPKGGQGDSQTWGHGMDASSQSKHVRIIAAIDDCVALVGRGMGRGAYISLEKANIKPFVTDIAGIRQAAQAYIDGKLDDLTERLH